MMAKAKLGPLTHKSEIVKNELCGSVLALRMKIWLIQESGVFFKENHHFVDSMIVKEMIKSFPMVTILFSASEWEKFSKKVTLRIGSTSLLRRTFRMF